MNSVVKKGSAAKIQINRFEDLFGTTVGQTDAFDQVIFVPLTELHTFPNHPFRVVDDEKMEEMIESVKQHGVLVPAVVRPRATGGYEIIAGHRRKRASEQAGLTELPVMVRNYTDDEATIIMVDSNIQRETMLPSEKAKAYRMKFEAMKHQGSREGKRTFDEIGELAGESGKTVQRYIWLSRLVEELLTMVDIKRLGIIQGIDISFLSVEAQNWVVEVIKTENIVISTKQSNKLKELWKCEKLTSSMVRSILTDVKLSKRQVTIRERKLAQFFPTEYSISEIEEIIMQLLEEWKINQT